MRISVSRLLELYAGALLYGGLAIAAVVLLIDPRWLHQPIAVLVLIAVMALMRATPIRLSKYSFLTQTGIPTLAGALAAGPAPVVLALVLGVVGGDVLWLRKAWRAGLINAGREVLGFTAAYGAYALVLRWSGGPGLSLDALPAVFTLAGMYFLLSRALFYFTLLLRSKLETVEQLLILRWEVVSFLLTIIGATVIVGALRSLAWEGWVAVSMLLGVLGLLTKRILEEAIAAEDLNKVHLMETTIAGNANLHASFEQIERVGYRLLEWGDFRIYRWQPAAEQAGNGHGPARAGAGARLVYRGAHGRPNRGEPFEVEALRHEAIAHGRPVVVRHTGSDPRTPFAPSDVQTVIVHPVRFGEEILGTLEIDHWKRHVFGPKDVTALSTLAAQVATAIHIAELRRPLVTTVDQIGLQVQALERATESLRGSAAALGAVSRSMRQAADDQQAFVAAGFEAITSLALATNDMAEGGNRAAQTSQAAAAVAVENRAVIGRAIERLVSLKAFVADSTEQVSALGSATRRITGFIGTIREIADFTSLIALNAAIEAARAGAGGRGFAVVAEEVRDLAAQSMATAREASGLLSEIAAQVDSVSGHMERGREVVAGVEELSAGAAEALDAIVETTGTAGDHARAIAQTAATQETALQELTDQIDRVAHASARTRAETETLAGQADEAARGQAELEHAIRELGEVARHLQTIARHFAAAS
jgi:methyl-accepting chemotaxis protein